MNNKILSLAFLVTLLSLSCASNKPINLGTNNSLADFAILQVPIEIDIVHLNQKAINIIPAYQKIITYRLPVGKQVLGLRYNNLLTNDDGEQETIKSHTVELLFNAEKDQTYQVKFIAPASFIAAKDLANSLELTLYSQDIVIAQSSSNNLWNVANISTDIDKIDDLKKPTDNAPAGEQLHYWWQIASESERRKFITQISQQD